VRDVCEHQIGSVRGDVIHVGDPPLRRVVLDVDRRDVAARNPTSEPARRELVELFGALEHDDVDVAGRSVVGPDLDRALGPFIRPCASSSVGTAVGKNRYQVPVGSMHERGHPRTVHVPHEDVHCTSTFV
jgi:hypothetical protein